MAVVERPELPGIPLGAFNELSLVVTLGVAQGPISLCGFKRGVLQAGYEIGP
jgi:hypothetical protein